MDFLIFGTANNLLLKFALRLLLVEQNFSRRTEFLDKNI